MRAAAAARIAGDATAEEMAEARYWVKDVVANPEVVDDAEPADIVLYVDREYEGGWPSFLAETPGGVR